jgi:hypothetical protein
MLVSGLSAFPRASPRRHGLNWERERNMTRSPVREMAPQAIDVPLRLVGPFRERMRMIHSDCFQPLCGQMQILALLFQSRIDDRGLRWRDSGRSHGGSVAGRHFDGWPVADAIAALPDLSYPIADVATGTDCFTTFIIRDGVRWSWRQKRKARRRRGIARKNRRMRDI